jgi:hypothetical protein
VTPRKFKIVIAGPQLFKKGNIHQNINDTAETDFVVGITGGLFNVYQGPIPVWS